MIEAVEYACRQASEYAQSAGTIYCTAPETSGWEIMTAIGTIGATVAAVLFGIVEINRSRIERARAKVEHRRQLLNNQFQKVTGIVAEMTEAFPLTTSMHSARFYAQVAIYEDLLTGSPETPLLIKQHAGNLFKKFGRIAMKCSALNSEKTKHLYDSRRLTGKDFQIMPEVVLYAMAMRLETTLSAWHATGFGVESTEAELKVMDEEFAEYEKRINEYEKL